MGMCSLLWKNRRQSTARFFLGYPNADPSPARSFSDHRRERLFCNEKEETRGRDARSKITACFLVLFMCRLTTSQTLSLTSIFLTDRLSAYLELIKPGITLSVLFSAFSGFFLGMDGKLFQSPWLLFHTLLGTALTTGGAGILNMLLEYETDALMQRTKNRPIPSGRVFPQEAFLLGVFMTSMGVVHLASMVNLLSCFIASLGVVCYLMFYTPLKQTSYFCTIIGAIGGAVPPLIGWAAAKNTLSLQAWSLFLILFVWQFPHLIALFCMYREDYERAGFKMLPIAPVKGAAAMAFLISVLLFPVALIPYWFKMSGTLFLYSAMILNLFFLYTAVQFFIKKNQNSARILFFASIFYLPFLFILLMI